MKRTACVLLVMCLVAVTAQAEWYTGVDVGYVEHEFTPSYSSVSGLPDLEFKNEASGTEIGINGGFMQELCKHASVGFQAHVSANDSEWTLNLPDPANFAYKQPFTWGLSVMPVIKLCKKSTLILEAGLVQGAVEEDKYGSLESNAKASETIGGTLLAVGLSYKMCEESGLENPAIIVDANHSNSAKQYMEQPRIVKEVLVNMGRSDTIKKLLRGIMIESYIEEGSQKIEEGTYGKSITDACLSWKDTEKLLLEMAELL